MTVEEAKKFVMPFGKYKGSTFGTIMMCNWKYLSWLRIHVNFWKNEMNEAVVVCLGAVDDREAEGRWMRKEFGNCEGWNEWENDLEAITLCDNI